MAELQRFCQGLDGFSGQPISGDSLRASIRLHNETRRLLSQLDNQRSHLTARSFYAAVEASMVMPKEHFNPLATELVELLSEKAPRQRGPRLILVGPVLDDPTVLDILDDLGACVSAMTCAPAAATSTSLLPRPTLKRKAISLRPWPTVT